MSAFPKPKLDPSFVGRVPPQDLLAEQSLLGSALLHPEGAEAVAALPVDEFYWTSHRVIAEAIVELVRERKPVDILTVGDRLKSKGLIEEAGELSYVSSLSNHSTATMIHNLDAHARIIRAKAVLRRVVEAANDWVKRAYDHADPTALLREIGDLAQSADGQVEGVRSARAVADELIREIQLMNETQVWRSFVTGVPVLDDNLWIKETDLFVIAGRPGTGKTTVATDVLRSVASSGRSGTYVSGEMPDTDLVARTAKAYGATDSEVFRRPTSPARVFPVVDAVNRIGKLPINFTTQNRADDVLRILRKQARAKQISCVVVDMLQTLSIPEAWGNNMAERLEEAASRFKNFALEERVPVFLLSSMNRTAGDDGNGRPTMSSLKGSGAIESYADTVLLIHRLNDTLSEWIFGKAREGIGEGKVKQDRAKLVMRRDFAKGQFVEASAPDEDDGRDH